ncbi:hypothetical protein V6N13_035541 [Hibiscus sabdariffa]
MSLKVVFPRIFALAACKGGVIADFGHFVEGVWQWKIEMRRCLCDNNNELYTSQRYCGNKSRTVQKRFVRASISLLSPLLTGEGDRESLHG